ncbi:MAG: hypothetical protein ABW133_11285 [Polyangiaceae bacterium]
MTPHRASAWVLNLDAEYELASPDAHTSSARVNQRLPELAKVLAPLFGAGDVVLGEKDVLAKVGADAPMTADRQGAYVGRAWCPTPRAIARLEAAGAAPIPAPPFSVLRHVNHRRFSAELGQTLPGATFVTTESELRATRRAPTPSGHWLVKRPFGFAGRGRRRIAAGDRDASAESWLAASVRGGEGVQVEPWVAIVADYALHGFVAPDRAVTLGEPTRQICDEHGAWKGTAIAVDLAPEEAVSLEDSARIAGEALAIAGYFGPFGVDAYRWQDGARTRFNARSEINARYSMGWAIGMRGRRVDLA